MKMMTTALVALTAAVTAAPAAAQTYDAFTSFDGTQGGSTAPNKFFYGSISPANPTTDGGTNFTISSGCLIAGSTCLQSSAAGGNASLPGVYKGGSPVNQYTTVTVPQDRLLVHPGSNSDLTYLAFGAPTAGAYRLYASFNSQDSNPTGIDIYRLGVTNGGGFPITYNQVAFNTTTPFSDFQLVNLAQGENIAYGIGNGGNFYNDSTGVTFSVLAGVPEPTTWSLMILGFGLVGFAMRRRAAVRTTVAYA